MNREPDYRHEIKIAPEYYEAVAWGRKNFELRKDDRGYQVGDILCMKEWDGQQYTDKAPLNREITYILRDCPEYGLKAGYCILGF